MVVETPDDLANHFCFAGSGWAMHHVPSLTIDVRHDGFDDIFLVGGEADGSCSFHHLTHDNGLPLTRMNAIFVDQATLAHFPISRVVLFDFRTSCFQ